MADSKKGIHRQSNNMKANTLEGSDTDLPHSSVCIRCIFCIFRVHMSVYAWLEYQWTYICIVHAVLLNLFPAITSRPLLFSIPYAQLAHAALLWNLFCQQGDKCNIQFQFTAAFTWRVAVHELGGFGSLWYPTPLQGSKISIPLQLEHKGPFISPWIILVWDGWGSKIGNVHLRPVRIFLLATQGWCHVFTDTQRWLRKGCAIERMITGRGGGLNNKTIHLSPFILQPIPQAQIQLLN